MVIILLAYGPCVVILNCLGQVLYLGRAPRTKKTLPDFREWCRVTRHPRVFRGLTGCQLTPRFWGVTISDIANLIEGSGISNIMLPNGTRFHINNALYSSKSIRNLLSFKDIRRN